MTEEDHDVTTGEPDAAPDTPSDLPASTGRAPLQQLQAYLPTATPVWRDRALVVLIALLVFLPFLGSFGLWDPWETHYGEVGRQITERNDWISTWWGSHWKGAKGTAEGNYFFSKPILLMWMMAMGLSVFGINEWGIRIGVCLVAVLALALLYSMGKSVFSRRVGFLMAAVTGTSPFFFFLSRQAQTDMPFVGMMTVGMCFFMMGAFGRDRKLPADKTAYALTFSWLALVAFPQFSIILVGLARWRGEANVVMNALAGTARSSVVYACVLIALAAIPFLLGIRRRWRDPDAPKPFKIGYGWLSLAALWVPSLILLVAVLVTARSGHGALRNLNGWFVWGPTQVSLYLTCLGAATWWTVARPVVARARLYLFLFYIFIGMATLAKGLLGFMLPGAILFFYILITREWRMLKDVELGRGILIFIAVTFPWYASMLILHTRGFWNRFFVHDHFKRLASGVHAIDEGSFEHFIRWLGYGIFPWTAFIPAALARLFVTPQMRKSDDDRTRATLMIVLWAAIAFTLFTLSSTKFHHYIFPVVPALTMLVALALDDVYERPLPSPWPLYLVAVGLMGVIAWDIIMDPQTLKNLFTYKYDRKWDNEAWTVSFRWTLVAVTVPALVGTVLMLMKNRVVRRGSVALIFVSGVAFAYFCLNVYMPRLSQSWSQKGLWDAYYAQCTRKEAPPGMDTRKKYCVEPTVAYKLNWRGETYYTGNEVVPIREDEDFTLFLKELGEGGTFYGIMEMPRYRGEFQRKLPKALRGKACVTFARNLKFVLAKAPCAPDDPHRIPEDQLRRKPRK